MLLVHTSLSCLKRLTKSDLLSVRIYAQDNQVQKLGIYRDQSQVVLTLHLLLDC